jgi:PLP dependent protein
MLLHRLQSVEKRIQEACQGAGRPRKDVQLLLASKKVSAERLLELKDTTNLLLGENTAQELVSKQDSLKHLPFVWHFIGHLQTNKVKDIVGRCALIHSVDRLSLAQEISKRSVQNNIQTSILVEVNTSAETSKSGVLPLSAIDFCRQISTLPGLQIEGLMTVAENSSLEKNVRENFRCLKALAQEIEQLSLPHVKMKTLSMGMSQDFEWAIEEGATLIRIGSLVFGERS